MEQGVSVVGHFLTNPDPSFSQFHLDMVKIDHDPNNSRHTDYRVTKQLVQKPPVGIDMTVVF